MEDEKIIIPLQINSLQPSMFSKFVKCSRKLIYKINNFVFLLVKRLIDIIVGIIGIIILILIAPVIKIMNLIFGDKGNIIYTQERIGKDGKLFKLYKFRSMVSDADEILYDYLKQNPEAHKEYKINKKLKNDPRITEVGNFIRKTSIDELPQLINVFKGEMSLVGPRPYLPREIKDMKEHYELIITSKPGITGLWQVSGRSKTTFEDRIKFDEEYNENKNLLMDIKILLKTVTVVFKGEGAV